MSVKKIIVRYEGMSNREIKFELTNGTIKEFQSCEGSYEFGYDNGTNPNVDEKVHKVDPLLSFLLESLDDKLRAIAAELGWDEEDFEGRCVVDMELDHNLKVLKIEFEDGEGNKV